MSQIVTDEQGQQHEFPDEATPEQMMQALASVAASKPSSFGEQFRFGVGETARGVGQKLLAGAEALGIPTLGSITGRPELTTHGVTEDIRAKQAAYRSPEGFDYGRTIGNVAATLPLVAIPGGPIMGGIAAGALSGAAQPVTNESEIGKQTALQAGLGGAAGGLGGGAAKLVAGLIGGARGTIPGAVEALGKEGVTPTVGQAVGGLGKDIEERLATLPFAGGPIRQAQQRATETLNVAAYNRALAPIGEKITPGTLGGDAVAEISGKLSDAYDKVVPNLTFAKTPELAMDMRKISVPGLGPDATAKAQNIVIETLGPDASLTGDAVKSVQSQLRDWASRYGGSASPVDQGVGQFLKKALNTFESHLEKQNPDSAPALKAINQGWANYARIRDAASKIGTEDNVFTAAQLQNAVRAGDRSVGKGDFAKGQALMQDLSQPAKQVMSRPIGTSGTAERLSIANPMALGEGAIAYPATALAYSPAGQKLLTALMTQRPEQARAIAELLRRSGGAAGLASSQLVPSEPY